MTHSFETTYILIFEQKANKIQKQVIVTNISIHVCLNIIILCREDLVLGTVFCRQEGYPEKIFGTASSFRSGLPLEPGGLFKQSAEKCELHMAEDDNADQSILKAFSRLSLISLRAGNLKAISRNGNSSERLIHGCNS